MDENLGSKMGNEIFLKQIFLGGNFGEQVLEEQVLLGKTLRKQKFWEEFLQEKFHSFWRGKIWGGGAKIFGSKLLSLIVL